MKAAILGLLLCLPARAQIYAENLPLDHPAIQYQQQPSDDPVARLIREIDSGKTKLQFHPGGLGYLPSLLEHLGVNVDSQALVFSKTSFQADRISPRNPRAIYFNDDVAVGFVPGGEGYEVAGLDPRQGVVFYSLDGRPDQPRFARREACMHCHQGPATLGVPGMFIGSVDPNPSGTPTRNGAIITDHRTPFEDRWGGWYVNGKHGEQHHKGNSVAPDPAEPHTLMPMPARFDAANYLSPLSDIVALMTFEHQTQMANYLTRIGWQSRIGAEPDIEDAVAYMLFSGEAPLREPVEGASSFTKTFPERGPRDHQGRSLRDFDLQKRLFRYPLSYMIYSAAFDALPDPVRDRIYHRLYDVLTGEDQTPKFAHLSKADRRNILEILEDTKPSLPSWWPRKP